MFQFPVSHFQNSKRNFRINFIKIPLEFCNFEMNLGKFSKVS